MLKPGETKMLIPTNSPDAHIKNMRYLIQYVSESRFLVHKELDAFEQSKHQPMHLFEYDGATYLCGAAWTDSEDSADRIVAGYWCAIDHLNELAKPPARIVS